MSWLITPVAVLAAGCYLSRAEPAKDAASGDPDAGCLGGWCGCELMDGGWVDCAGDVDGAPPGAECRPGTARWCARNAVEDFWGKAPCHEDGTWSDCGKWSEDRPATACACRRQFADLECCERPDCVVPADHHPPDCHGDGGLCSFCSTDLDCGGPDDLCLWTPDEATFCGAVCSGDADCPAGFECSPIYDYDGNVTAEQCTPVDRDGCDGM